MPRLFGPARHGTEPNDLVQFDFIKMGVGTTGEKYILVLRDDHNSYCWLYSAATKSAEKTAHALLDWCAAFGTPKGLMSDGRTYFKNEAVELPTRGLSTPHHFTLPHCPWSNGIVERWGEKLLRVARAILLECQLRPNE